MKFAFLIIAMFINFFNHSLLKSEEKIFSSKNKIENITRKESITGEKTIYINCKNSQTIRKRKKNFIWGDF